jgi:ABC-type transporter Mla MlaB component
MEELRHYVESKDKQGAHHVIVLPPVFTGEEGLEAFERIMKKVSGHAVQLRVDCSQLKRIDSTGVGAIVVAITRDRAGAMRVRVDSGTNQYSRALWRRLSLSVWEEDGGAPEKPAELTSPRPTPDDGSNS